MKALKIGIVEDEVLIADNIAMHLEDMGHTVVGVAERFEETIDQLHTEAPDLFLIDIQLKGEFRYDGGQTGYLRLYSK